MADKKKPTKIAVNDVVSDDKTAPDTSAKPIIVTNRPIMKDPMVTEKPAEKRAVNKPKPAKTIVTPDLKPSVELPKEEKPAPKAVDPEVTEKAEAAEQAEHDATVQKLVDGKQYFLPINAVEKRKSRRFILLGVVLSLVLAVAWVDVALDAGLIHISGLKPATHFFSN